MNFTILPGYVFEITTCENDGDNYKTKKLYGLSKEVCLFYKIIAQSFYDANSHKNCFGNEDCCEKNKKRFVNNFGEGYKNYIAKMNLKKIFKKI